jgi:hypothetical protein
LHAHVGTPGADRDVHYASRAPAAAAAAAAVEHLLLAVRVLAVVQRLRLALLGLLQGGGKSEQLSNSATQQLSNSATKTIKTKSKRDGSVGKRERERQLDPRARNDAHQDVDARVGGNEHQREEHEHLGARQTKAAPPLALAAPGDGLPMA